MGREAALAAKAREEVGFVVPLVSSSDIFGSTLDDSRKSGSAGGAGGVMV